MLRSGSLVRRGLKSAGMRMGLAVGGIGAGSLLVLVLLAAYRSPTSCIAAYSTQRGVDLWVTPVGGDNLMRSASFLPAELADALRGIEDVAGADPLVRTFVTATPDRDGALRERDDRVTLFAIGYRAPSGLGGPPSIASGEPPAAEDEVAIDVAAAFRLGVGPGDRLRVNERTVRVTGLTRGTNMLASQFLFFDFGSAGSAMGLSRYASLVAVQVAPGRDPAAVARRIEDAHPGVWTFTAEEFAANNLREAASGFLPVLLVVAMLGISASVLLVALLIQGMVEDRRRDLAVLFAMGAGSGLIARALLLNATWLVLAGCVTGVIASRVLGAVLGRFLPTIELTFRPGDLAVTVLAFCIAGLAGAALPLVRVARVDPLEAFA